MKEHQGDFVMFRPMVQNLSDIEKNCEIFFLKKLKTQNCMESRVHFLFANLC
jgi:hypothetical protein